MGGVTKATAARVESLEKCLSWVLDACLIKEVGWASMIGTGTTLVGGPGGVKSDR